MERTSTRTEQILMVMRVLAWIAFIGFMIQAGAIIISFVVSCVNPEAAKNLYKGLNRYDLRQHNFVWYLGSVSLMVALLSLKAYACNLVIKLLSNMTLANPFTMEVVRMLETISYVLFSAWVIGMISNGYAAWLEKRTVESFGREAIVEILFMAGIVFVISQIFKRGVEIQTENELTV